MCVHYTTKTLWPHRPKLCAIMSLPFQALSRWGWDKKQQLVEQRPLRTPTATHSACTSPLPAKPHPSPQEPWATVKLASEENSRNICFMIIVFKFPSSNYHFSFLGSKSLVAPAGHFIKPYLQTLDICQVGRQSCLCEKGRSHTPAMQEVQLTPGDCCHRGHQPRAAVLVQS